jgi:hypothetical protein
LFLLLTLKFLSPILRNLFLIILLNSKRWASLTWVCFNNLCKLPCCRPEPTFLSPRGVRGVPRAYFFVAPRLKPRGPPSLFFVAPSPFLCRPEHPFFVAPSASEGSLGTCVPREDTVENVAPSLSFYVAPSASEGSLGAYAPWNDKKKHAEPLFLSPRAQARGPSALTCLGKTSLGTPSRTKCLMGRRPERSEGCLAKLGRTK